MIRRPPRSTRTDTLFPYTTLFRSFIDPTNTYIGKDAEIGRDTIIHPNVTIEGSTVVGEGCVIRSGTRHSNAVIGRSEERRVGKECGSMCRSRWSRSHEQKKTEG